MTSLIPVPRYLDRQTFIAVLSCGHQRRFATMTPEETKAYCLACWTARKVIHTILMIPPEAA